MISKMSVHKHLKQLTTLNGTSNPASCCTPLIGNMYIKVSRNFAQIEVRPLVPVMWALSCNLLCKRPSALAVAPASRRSGSSSEHVDVSEQYLGHWKRKRRKRQQRERNVYNRLLCRLNWQTCPFETKSTRSGCLSGPGVLHPQETRKDRDGERDKRSPGRPRARLCGSLPPVAFDKARPSYAIPENCQHGRLGFLSSPHGQSQGYTSGLEGAWPTGPALVLTWEGQSWGQSQENGEQGCLKWI